MNDVRKHVNKLFAKYPKTAENMELKEEMIGNLEAEMEDLQNEGLSLADAFHISTGKIATLDGLIDDVQSIRMSKVLMEMLQWTLIYTLVSWILTIPLSIFHPVRSISWALFWIIVVIGLSYVIFYMIREVLSKEDVKVSLAKIATARKYVWIIWTLFIIINWGMVTATLFGSNIWFWRPISINGPYAFANIGIMYIMPLITIIMPLLTSKYYTVVIKQGEGTTVEE